MSYVPMATLRFFSHPPNHARLHYLQPGVFLIAFLGELGCKRASEYLRVMGESVTRAEQSDKHALHRKLRDAFTARVVNTWSVNRPCGRR